MAMWLRDFPYPGALLQESAIAASQIPDGDLDFVSWRQIWCQIWIFKLPSGKQT